MDALFQGQSMAHTPQSRLDPDLEGLASDSELYIFNQDDGQEWVLAYFGYVLAYIFMFRVGNFITITLTITINSSISISWTVKCTFFS